MKEVVIDSNVVIRLLVRDSPLQLLQAQNLLKDIEEKRIQGLISILVINEIIWILEKFYDLKRKSFIPKILKFLALKNVKIIEAEKILIIGCLKKMEKRNFDFTDVYLSKIGKKEQIFSFDKDFEKLFNNN